MKTEMHLCQNDPHQGAAGIDFDFSIRWPPPLACMRWFCHFYAAAIADTLSIIAAASQA